MTIYVFQGFLKFILPGMTSRMGLTKSSFRIHTKLKFNRPKENLVILKETSKAGKTSQMIFGKIYTEHLHGPMARACEPGIPAVSQLHTCRSLFCSVRLGLGVYKLLFPIPVSEVPALFCQHRILAGVQEARTPHLRLAVSLQVSAFLPWSQLQPQ